MSTVVMFHPDMGAAQDAGARVMRSLGFGSTYQGGPFGCLLFEPQPYVWWFEVRSRVPQNSVKKKSPAVGWRFRENKNMKTNHLGYPQIFCGEFNFSGLYEWKPKPLNRLTTTKNASNQTGNRTVQAVIYFWNSWSGP